MELLYECMYKNDSKLLLLLTKQANINGVNNKNKYMKYKLVYKIFRDEKTDNNKKLIQEDYFCYILLNKNYLSKDDELQLFY